MTAVVPAGCGGDDPVQSQDPPVIVRFTISPSDILPGDSALLAYVVRDADSVLLEPGPGRQPSPDSGSLWVRPARPTQYTLTAYNRHGSRSASVALTMSQAVPDVIVFSLSKDTLLAGDSTVLTWQTARADSIVVTPDIGRLPGSDSGRMTLAPPRSVTYRAVAYNDIGTDTATAAVRVEVPVRVESVFGRYHRGLMGQSRLEPEPGFRVLDSAGLTVTRAWVHLSLSAGDGLLGADSLLPGAGGIVRPQYTFSGALGHAVLQAAVPGVDSATVEFRANTLIPGTNGQGQYILFSDTLATVKEINGPPEGDTPDPRFFLQYVEYEQLYGVVVMVNDVNQNEQADDFEPVEGVIVTGIYPYKTADSIGLGSTLSDVVQVYGQPDTAYLDPTPPPATVYIYRSDGLTFFADTTSGQVIEIHLIEPSGGTALSPSLSRTAQSTVTAGEGRYRLVAPSAVDRP